MLTVLKSQIRDRLPGLQSECGEGPSSPLLRLCPPLCWFLKTQPTLDLLVPSSAFKVKSLTSSDLLATTLLASGLFPLCVRLLHITIPKYPSSLTHKENIYFAS